MLCFRRWHFNKCRLFSPEKAEKKYHWNSFLCFFKKTLRTYALLIKIPLTAVDYIMLYSCFSYPTLDYVISSSYLKCNIHFSRGPRKGSINTNVIVNHFYLCDEVSRKRNLNFSRLTRAVIRVIFKIQSICLREFHYSILICPNTHTEINLFFIFSKFCSPCICHRIDPSIF